MQRHEDPELPVSKTLNLCLNIEIWRKKFAGSILRLTDFETHETKKNSSSTQDPLSIQDPASGAWVVGALTAAPPSSGRTAVGRLSLK